MKKEKIYFKGYYGFSNLGDDIFCVTADYISNNIWKNKQPIFIGEKLPIVSNNAKTIEYKNRILRKITELFICLKSEYIIYFGGSTLSGKILGLKDLKYYLDRFSVFHQKLGSIGTSIGPFKTEEDYNSITKFLKKFNFIAVRDFSSLDIAKNIGLERKATFCFDIAILIKDVFPSLRMTKTKSKNGKIKLGISLCHYERYTGGVLI